MLGDFLPNSSCHPVQDRVEHLLHKSKKNWTPKRTGPILRIANASVVKKYNTMSTHSQLRFENKKIVFAFVKRSNLLNTALLL
jgi:hypothetical protein